MTTDIVRSKLNQSLKVRSLTDLIRVRTSEKVVLLLDVSGSMQTSMKNHQSRLEGLRVVVKGIQGQRQTDMIAFGCGGHESDVRRVTEVPNGGGGTPMSRAITLAKEQGYGRVIVISDGMPDNPFTTMEVAREFGGQIDVVFVGDEGEYGEEFLRELAAATGGTEFHGDLTEPKQLTSAVIGLLTNGEDQD